MGTVAVIGTREPNDMQVEYCQEAVKLITSLGFNVSTGMADGIDTIAVQNAPEEMVELYLPWRSYNEERVPEFPKKIIIYDRLRHNEWTESVYKYHSNPYALKRGGMALHARNYGIVVDAKAQLVVAFPSMDGGGTMQGVRIAKALNIPLICIYPNCMLDLGDFLGLIEKELQN